MFSYKLFYLVILTLILVLFRIDKIAFITLFLLRLILTTEALLYTVLFKTLYEGSIFTNCMHIGFSSLNKQKQRKKFNYWI